MEVLTYFPDLLAGNSLLFFNYLPHFHCLIIRYSHKINPAGQCADINCCYWLCGFLL